MYNNAILSCTSAYLCCSIVSCMVYLIPIADMSVDVFIIIIIIIIIIISFTVSCSNYITIQ